MENSMVHSSLICMIYINFDSCKLQQEGFESWFSNKNRTILKFKKKKKRNTECCTTIKFVRSYTNKGDNGF